MGSDIVGCFGQSTGKLPHTPPTHTNTVPLCWFACALNNAKYLVLSCCNNNIIPRLTRVWSFGGMTMGGCEGWGGLERLIARPGEKGVGVG